MEGNDDSFSFGKRAVSLLIVQTGAISLVAVASLLTLVLVGLDDEGSSSFGGPSTISSWGCSSAIL
ncbi:hypothetical protein FRC02_001643 [Tulasnella sp. 418]|nr:hypothetical protein FRC02_001643 [Tulasnella sp. 418]